MAEKDKRAGYDGDQQQQQSPQPQQSARPEVSQQQAADLMLALFQQVERQMRARTLNGSTVIDEELRKKAAIAAAAFNMFDSSLRNLGGSMGIVRLSDTEGPASGGEHVSVFGINFLPDSRVFFQKRASDGSVSSSIEADSVLVVSTTEIQLTTPPGSPGAVDVVVVGAFAGEDRLSNAYTYVS